MRQSSEGEADAYPTWAIPANRGRTVPRVEIPPTPEISHDEMIDQLHSGTSPFVHAGDGREDGYRDYLV